VREAHVLAFTFPGQGTQTTGMGAPWLEHPSWAVVEQVADATGRDVPRLLIDADDDELRSTDRAQLVTFTMGLVVLDAARRSGLDAALVAGHSLGELTALVAAGVLDVPNGARLVAARGVAMADAAAQRPGTMAAVLGLGPADLAAACDGLAHDVWPANDNAPGQVVISGSVDGVAAATDEVRRAGARRVMPLAVAGAFHTPMMAPARERLAAAVTVAELDPASIGVVSNVDARLHTDAEEWRRLVVAQLCRPVRWRESTLALVAAGAGVLVELGASKALTAMAKRTAPEVRARSITTPAHLEAVVAELAERPPPSLDDGFLGDDQGGERVHMADRVVVSPGIGPFTPADVLGAGVSVAPGQVLGQVGETDVCAPIAGTVGGFMALPGQRLEPRQPVAWLRP
jgi:[acyl-carrier-protein] S-malonyltransferase